MVSKVVGSSDIVEFEWVSFCEDDEKNTIFIIYCW